MASSAVISHLEAVCENKLLEMDVRFESILTMSRTLPLGPLLCPVNPGRPAGDRLRGSCVPILSSERQRNKDPLGLQESNVRNAVSLPPVLRYNSGTRISDNFVKRYRTLTSMIIV